MHPLVLLAFLLSPFFYMFWIYHTGAGVISAGELQAILESLGYKVLLRVAFPYFCCSAIVMMMMTMIIIPQYEEIRVLMADMGADSASLETCSVDMRQLIRRLAVAASEVSSVLPWSFHHIDCLSSLVCVCAQQRREIEAEEEGAMGEVERAWELFGGDAGGKGVITEASVRRVAQEIGEKLSDADIHEMIYYADTHKVSCPQDPRLLLLSLSHTHTPHFSRFSHLFLLDVVRGCCVRGLQNGDDVLLLI